mmetsp:Transcript_104177/g.334206  ORF Transcript_104177/g.334206 Transcript_104177/m.334206 type:complete len:221 (+) Transcript_104177:259-921(+)
MGHLGHPNEQRVLGLAASIRGRHGRRIFDRRAHLLGPGQLVPHRIWQECDRCAAGEPRRHRVHGPSGGLDASDGFGAGGLRRLLGARRKRHGSIRRPCRRVWSGCQAWQRAGVGPLRLLDVERSRGLVRHCPCRAKAAPDRLVEPGLGCGRALARDQRPLLGPRETDGRLLGPLHGALLVVHLQQHRPHFQALLPQLHEPSDGRKARVLQQLSRLPGELG